MSELGETDKNVNTKHNAGRLDRANNNAYM